ncbi:hypothetical protein NDU88_009798 [Pleurodeles waltl]|uniref:Uncharacterized protein n=1 Tax=Pleurodeles waltl TaxID=8319 RepID=A0AAV7S222_PLEWA|nr:hypothetical protein NDU88_009798 [Pleurodeles waltl]
MFRALPVIVAVSESFDRGGVSERRVPLLAPRRILRRVGGFGSPGAGRQASQLLLGLGRLEGLLAQGLPLRTACLIGMAALLGASPGGRGERRLPCLGSDRRSDRTADPLVPSASLHLGDAACSRSGTWGLPPSGLSPGGPGASGLDFPYA